MYLDLPPDSHDDVIAVNIIILSRRLYDGPKLSNAFPGNEVFLKDRKPHLSLSSPDWIKIFLHMIQLN